MSLTLITGPMFSGKTSYLISAINKYVIIKKKVLCINHSFDKRYSQDGNIHSHDGKTVSNSTKNIEYITQISSDNLNDVISNIDINTYSAIFVDEGHFFQDITLVQNFIDNKKHVYISFLNSDYKMENFKVIDPLYSKADKIIHFTSVCNVCGADAPFTKRLTTSPEQILVGSNDSYEPRCRNCF